MSAILVPNKPFTHTSTLSPGSMKLTKAVSMPALPVPDIGIVNSFSVSNTDASRSLVLFIIVMNSGSRCPKIGAPSALSTLGCTPLGPGPISIRPSVVISG